MATRPRMNRAMIQVQKRHEAARAEYDAFWGRIPTAELEKIAAGDEDAMKRLYALEGYGRIEKITHYALTYEKKQELKKIEQELIKKI